MVGMIRFSSTNLITRFFSTILVQCDHELRVHKLVCRDRWKPNGVAGGGARADAAGEQYVEQQLLRVQSLSQMRAALANWWTLAFRNGKRERRVLVHCSLRPLVHSCSVEHVQARYEVTVSIRVQCVHPHLSAFIECSEYGSQSFPSDPIRTPESIQLHQCPS